MLNIGLIKSLSNPYSQPPASQCANVPNSTIFGRTDNFPGTYSLQRGPFSSLSGFNDRMSPYTNTPRVFDSTLDRPSSLVFGQTGSMYMEPMQRFSQSVADAPPFQDTDILHHPIIASGQTVKPEIQAKIHNKKFLNVDDKWTCYRRNYLAISCSFSLHPWSTGPFHLKFLDQGTEQIRNFSISISAIVNAQHEEVRELVQHTPKRDKQSERPPGRVRLQPLQPSTLGIGHGSATASNGQHGFTLTSQPAGLLDYSSSYASTSQPSQPPTHHTFERIQFQKATANNGKRRAQQQYYNLVVDLYAEVDSPTGSDWIKIARRVSQPMVVRGRSPGHYRDGRPDSSASMGPDGNGSNDGNVLPPGVGNVPGSSLALMSYDSSQRGRGPYGRPPDYRQPMRTEQSPLSDSPHISSSSSSSAFDIGMLNDSMDPMDTIKATSSMCSYDGGYTMTCPPDRRPLGITTTTTTGGPYRHPLSSFDYDAFSRDSDGGGGSASSSFPDTVASMVSMMPHEQNDVLRNLPRLPSQHSQPSSSGGYDSIYSNIRPGDETSSYGRFDSMQNSQGLRT